MTAIKRSRAAKSLKKRHGYFDIITRRNATTLVLMQNILMGHVVASET